MWARRDSVTTLTRPSSHSVATPARYCSKLAIYLRLSRLYKSFALCGVCLKKSEPILRRTPTNEDAPPLPRFARQHQRKMSLAFRICARPISSKKERTFFFGVLPSKYSGSWRGDNSIRSGMAEFPPHPPSAMPSLPTANFLAAALRKEWKVDIIDLQVIKVLYHFPYIIIYYVHNRQEHKEISSRQRAFAR